MARKEDLLKQLEAMEAFVASDEFKELNVFQASQYLSDIDEIKQRLLNIDTREAEANMSPDELYDKRRLELLEKEKSILEEILKVQKSLNDEQLMNRLTQADAAKLAEKKDRLEKDLENVRDEQIVLDEAYFSSPSDYVSSEDLGQLDIDAGIDDEAVAQRNIKEMIDEIKTQEVQGDNRTIYKYTPGEGRQLKVGFVGDENDILEQKAYKFFDELYKKYGPQLARLAYETNNFEHTFARNPLAPTYQATIIDGKYLYQDLLIIDNAFQKKGYGTSLGLEVIQWAVENGLYVIAMPVNSEVRASMLNNPISHQIGTDMLFYGTEEQLAAFRKDFLEDYYNGVFDVQMSVEGDGFWDVQYNKLLKEYNNLFPEEQNLLKNNINHRFGTRNKVHKDTTRLLNYIYSNTPANEIDWKTFKIYETLDPIEELLNEGEMGDYTDENRFLRGGATEEAMEKLYLDALDNDDAKFVKWLLTTNDGNFVLDELIQALEKNNRTVDDYDWEKIERIFEKNSYIREHLENASTSRLTQAEQRINISGRTTEISKYNFEDIWTGEYSNYDKEWIKNLYDNRYRKRWIQNFESIGVSGESGAFGAVLSWLTNNQLLTSFRFPKLDIPPGSNILRVYRAASAIDGALGMRVPDWRPQGGRTSGFGSNNYFATTSNYTQDYRVFSRPTLIYDIDITGWSANEILDFHTNLNLYDRGNIIASLGNNPAFSMIVNKLKEKIPETNTYRYKTFGEIYHTIGNKEHIQKPLIDSLKSGGYRAILHQWTGRGGYSYISYSTQLGSERIHIDGRDRIQEEIIFLEPEDLSYGIYELENSKGATGRSDTIIKETDYKPFNPKDAIIEDIQRWFKFDNEITYQLNAVSTLERELNREFENRKEIIDNIFPKAEREDLLKSISNIYNMLREELALAQQEGRPSSTKNVRNKILKEIGSNSLSIQRTLDDFSSLPIVKNNAPNIVIGYDNIRNVDVFPSPFGSTYKYLIKNITLPNGSTFQGFYQVIRKVDDNVFQVRGPYGIEEVKLDYSWKLVEVPEDFTPVESYGNDYLNFRLDNQTDGTTPKSLIIDNETPLEVLEDGGKYSTNFEMAPTLEHLFNNPINQKIRINLFHVSHDGPVLIDNVRAGAYKANVPVSDKYGNVEWQLLNNFLDGRNMNASVGLSFALDKDFINENYRAITGRTEAVIPNETLNAYKAILNTNDIVTMEAFMNGSWINSFDIEGAAKTLGTDYDTLINIMEKNGIISIDNLTIKGKEIMFHNGNLIGQAKMFEFAQDLQRLSHLSNFNLNAINTKFLRGGGIEGYIVYPNAIHPDHPELVLFDPNDQLNVGKYVDIIDIPADTAESTYQLVSDEIEPLRTREDIRFVSDQEVLDNAFNTKTQFEAGFRTVQDEALGLTGDIPDIIKESIFDEDTVRAVVYHGNNLDNATVSSARDILISNIEEPLRLTQQEAVQQMVAAIKAGKFVDIHNLTLRQRAIEKASARLARSVATRGAVNTGFLMLDILELATLGAAALYGTSDYWTKYLSDAVNDITNGVLGTDYNMETVEVDMDKYIKSLETADKVSPFSWLYRNIAEKPLMETLGEYDFSGGVPTPVSPYRRPGVFATVMGGAIAGISPGVTAEDLGIGAEPPSFDDIVNSNRYYNFTGPVRDLSDYPQTTQELRALTPEEQEYTEQGPWERLWKEYKIKYDEYHNRKLTQPTYWWLPRSIENQWLIQDTEDKGIYGTMVDSNKDDY